MPIPRSSCRCGGRTSAAIIRSQACSFRGKLERAAFRAAGGEYRAPVQLVGDFLADKESYYFGEVKPSYARGTRFVPMQAIFPRALTDAMKAALPDMDRKLSGFAAYEAVMTGVESRTSSPVRILRDAESLQAEGVVGVYPAARGAAMRAESPLPRRTASASRKRSLRRIARNSFFLKRKRAGRPAKAGRPARFMYCRNRGKCREEEKCAAVCTCAEIRICRTAKRTPYRYGVRFALREYEKIVESRH